MVNSGNKEGIEIGGFEDVKTRFPDQLVAFRVEEVIPGVGVTKGLLIARGPRREQARVLTELDKFREADPESRFGLFYTGRMTGLDSGLVIDADGDK